MITTIIFWFSVSWLAVGLISVIVGIYHDYKRGIDIMSGDIMTLVILILLGYITLWLLLDVALKETNSVIIKGKKKK